MSNKYHSDLVEAVGSSFYYYTEHENFNLSNPAAIDFESFTSGWVDKYRGSWDIYNSSAPMTYNTFKPCVDQLVYRILSATESEIERRVNERVSEFVSDFDKKIKETQNDTV